MSGRAPVKALRWRCTAARLGDDDALGVPVGNPADTRGWHPGPLAAGRRGVSVGLADAVNTLPMSRTREWAYGFIPVDRKPGAWLGYAGSWCPTRWSCPGAGSTRRSALGQPAGLRNALGCNGSRTRSGDVVAVPGAPNPGLAVDIGTGGPAPSSSPN